MPSVKIIVDTDDSDTEIVVHQIMQSFGEDQNEVIRQLLKEAVARTLRSYGIEGWFTL